MPRPPLGAPTPAGLERDVGMERYATATPGIGGRLKTTAEDFVVEEVPLAFPPPAEGGKYTVAALRAKNWETNRLMGELARRLGVPRESVFFAGTKDKRAVTTQYVSLRAPEEAVRALDLKDVEVLETRRVDRAPKIGELVGNRFIVRVRGHRGSAAGTLDELKRAGGFPNYFGVQRFGVVRPITHLVGEAIVRGDLEKAVRLYVGHPLPGEPPEAQEARGHFDKTNDPASALEVFPRHLQFERSMLHHLRDHPGDHEGALLQLPRNLATMFVYSAQSLLFNRVVARRLERGIGLNEPTLGDVVVGIDAEGRPEKDRQHKVTPRNLDRVGKLCAAGRALVTGAIFGSEEPFADGEMGEIEREVVAEARYEREDFRIPKLPEVASRGTRRELLAPLGPVRSAEGSDESGAYLELSFFLLKGSYATCLLREVMKSPGAAYA